MNAIISKDTTGTDIRGISVYNIKLACNRFAKTGISMDGISNARFYGLTITMPLIEAFRITGNSYDTRIADLTMNNFSDQIDTAQRPDYGLHVYPGSTDIQVAMIIASNFKKAGVRDESGPSNKYLLVHSYASPQPLFNAEYAADINSATIVDLYSDGVNIAPGHIRGSGARILGGTFYWQYVNMTANTGSTATSVNIKAISGSRPTIPTGTVLNFGGNLVTTTAPVTPTSGSFSIPVASGGAAVTNNSIAAYKSIPSTAYSNYDIETNLSYLQLWPGYVLGDNGNPTQRQNGTPPVNSAVLQIRTDRNGLNIQDNFRIKQGGAATASLDLERIEGFKSTIRMMTGNRVDWEMNENAIGDFAIERKDGSGNYINSPIYIAKANGLVTFDSSIDVGRTAKFRDSVLIQRTPTGGPGDSLLVKDGTTKQVKAIAQNSIGGGTDTAAASFAYRGQSNLFILKNTFADTVFFSSKGISIGGPKNASKALLELNSTTKGLLLPRLTSTEVTAVAPDSAGLLVYNRTVGRPNIYNGVGATGWQPLITGANMGDSLNKIRDTLNIKARLGANTFTDHQTIAAGKNLHLAGSTLPLGVLLTNFGGNLQVKKGDDSEFAQLTVGSLSTIGPGSQIGIARRDNNNQAGAIYSGAGNIDFYHDGFGGTVMSLKTAGVQFPVYTAGVAKFDASGNITSGSILQSNVSGMADTLAKKVDTATRRKVDPLQLTFRNDTLTLADTLLAGLEPSSRKYVKGFWIPFPNTVTPSNAIIGNSFTAATQTARAIIGTTAGNDTLTNYPRMGHVTAATSASVSQLYGTQYLVNMATGFTYTVTFASTSPAPVATQQMFAGMYANQGAVAGNVSPTAYTNCFGVGKDAADANFQFFYNDGSGSATKVDLGANFPANTDNIDFYEATFYVPKGGGSVTYWLRRRNVPGQARASGTVSTNIPAVNRVYVSNGTTALAASVDVYEQLLYIQKW